MAAFKCFLPYMFSRVDPFTPQLSLTGIAYSGTVSILIQGFLIVCFSLSFSISVRFLSHTV